MYETEVAAVHKAMHRGRHTFARDVTIVIILLQICAAFKHPLHKVVRMAPSRQLWVMQKSALACSCVGGRAH